MKILNKSEFLKLPAGTLYSRYQPCAFFGLSIKGENFYDGNNNPVDYCELDLIGNVKNENDSDFISILDNAEKNKSSFDLDFDIMTRNGLYENDERFAVYERVDIEKFIETLQNIKLKAPK